VEPASRIARAIIFIRDATDAAAFTRCINHVRACGYRLLGVIAGDWATAQAEMDRTGAEVIVIDSRTDMPDDATPRLEVVAEMPKPGPPAAGGRRRTAPRRRITRVLPRAEEA